MSTLNSEAMMRYLYNEMSSKESTDFLSHIKEHPELNSQFSEIKEGFENLENIQFSPSPEVINKLLQYGASVSQGMDLQ
jgi:hypothetical protein